ncbi:hypothetical protein ACFLU5_07945 [Bacteroidota bacterium]
MPEDRRLAAIMFTDIVGYTALMGSDEDKAFQLLRKNRDLQRPLIKKYKGEWLKEMGDRPLRKCPVDIFREGPGNEVSRGGIISKL